MSLNTSILKYATYVEIAGSFVMTNKSKIKTFLAYLILTIVLGGCVGGILTGIYLGGMQAFFVFLMVFGIMAAVIGAMFSILWAAHYLTHR
jgi:hypothetical protein